MAEQFVAIHDCDGVSVGRYDTVEEAEAAVLDQMQFTDKHRVRSEEDGLCVRVWRGEGECCFVVRKEPHKP